MGLFNSSDICRDKKPDMHVGAGSSLAFNANSDFHRLVDSAMIHQAALTRQKPIFVDRI